MQAFLVSFLIVFLAEIGDKTQLLAMALASRYSWEKVLLGIFLATVINQVLAVFVGQFLATYLPFGVVSLVAALSFIVFGLWTLRGEHFDQHVQKSLRFGPVLTAGIAFFIAEIGDKTQLATVSLAVKYRQTLGVLLGTTLAMIAANIVGIIAGVLMRKHIPDTAIRYGASVLFIVFGFVAVFQALHGHLAPFYLWIVMCTLVVFTAVLAGIFLKRPVLQRSSQ